jgi:hypothetical protein
MTEIVASQANIKAGKANAVAAKAAAAKEAVAAAAGGAAAPARAAKAPKAAKKQTAAAANKANKFVTPSAGSRELQLFTQALSAEAVTFSVDVTYKRPSSEQVVLSRALSGTERYLRCASLATCPPRCRKARAVACSDGRRILSLRRSTWTAPVRHQRARAAGCASVLALFTPKPPEVIVSLGEQTASEHGKVVPVRI